ncbi:PREDICTED: uncharacterized protein LOC109179742 [Ipomoea nil]|uniref:uncharacterized protein LOC109179742 n=1 Tax=Ipomoea nil TaxID=35883 RepID=UPI0009017F31|nr:PREDICTED: uncharacterized protein LOC109179742 [Ipomoea nil]
MTGRPKKKRKLEDNEKQKQKISSEVKKLSRKGRLMTCQLCKGKGHNKRFCPTLSSQQEESTNSFAVRGRGRPTTAVRGRGRERGRGRGRGRGSERGIDLSQESLVGMSACTK